MISEPKGRDLFIVDNSVLGWTGLRYLGEWTEIANQFDIATGYFDVGALLSLDGKWQRLKKIRILMGAQAMPATRKILLEGVKARAREHLDASIEADKDRNPFGHGIPAILDALQTGQIECRVYDRAKFHAKAYITHAELEVIGSQALVGSSNFTEPGLNKNIELNIQVQSAREVAQLQEWYETYWEEATDVSAVVATTIERHTRIYSPFEVYAKALQEFFRGHELTESEWDETDSRMFRHLDRYQKEAYWNLIQIARQHGGAFLCDGVGLGKTFVGLMLIERLVLHERKRVVLLAPKGAKEAVWEPHLRQYLAHIGGIGSSADFSNLSVLSHTDLNRGGEFPGRLRRIAELADAVVIDEAHHFRNPGQRGDPTASVMDSRYYKLFDMLDPAVHPKSVYLLTATPINNRLSDFRHMVELFSRRNEAYFAKTLGVNNLTAQFNRLEKDLRSELGGDREDLSDSVQEASELLARDTTFQSLVVQRSRAYAVESQKREGGSGTVFPDRAPPRVAEYSVRKTYGALLTMLEKAFEKSNPLFSLAMYYPLAYYTGPNKEIDPFEEGRQRQVVGLIRTQFLKRFESSVAAFEISCDRLLRKLLAFIELHATEEADRKRLDRWLRQNEGVLLSASKRQFSLWGDDDEDVDEDVIPDELAKQVPHLSRDEFKVADIVNETYLDLDQIVRFLSETQKFEPKNDDKLVKLTRLLDSKDLKDQKVLLFTEFADTARYLFRELTAANVAGLAQIDSGSKVNRAEIIERFSPYYNGSSSAELERRKKQPVRVLISTDILSEGLNLQDACRLVNYDIHWNPVRLMQRIGRVDRRLNPDVEKRLTTDLPDAAATRGKVIFWNFLPPGELEEILSLYRTVTGKALLISRTLGIEGKKLLRPEDDYEALRHFNQDYEGTKTAVEDMHLEYQDLLQQHPDLEDRLKALPGAVFTGRERVAAGVRGVFFCYGLPALDTEIGEFTLAAGPTRWYLYDLDRDAILDEPQQIVASIRSAPETPRRAANEEKTLVELRAKVEKHIKDTYLKRVDAPVEPRPKLRCWMELGEA
jgi:superfamily II DNA or RNA helicase